jgi:ABC-type phosphate transport system substrate-binding protein
MAMRPRFFSVALIMTLVLGLASRTLADDVAFKVIVNPKNPIAGIDREFLRNVFLKKETVWGGGETVRPVDLAWTFAVREHFAHEVLKKTPSQLKTYWNQQIFSGKGVPPPEADSPAEVIAYVLANPGAVGYLPANADPRGAKVIDVR